VSKDPLGALEFAAALNGDNPRVALDCLKRFVKIVQQERRIALQVKNEHKTKEDDSEDDSDESHSDDDDGDDSSSNSSDSDENRLLVEDNDDENQKKKFKKTESWKEDTKAYHVPFVGTSVAKGGRDRGIVVKGEWPTGLLKAYLERSPMAVELTVGDALLPPMGHLHKSLLRQKQGKLSQALYKFYLKALAELVTAAISKEALQKEEFPSRHTSSTTNTTKRSITDDNLHTAAQNRFMEKIMKERVPVLVTLLQTDTKRGKGKCGPMVQFALQVLANISMTSARNAKHVARELEQSVLEPVWKTIIRLPPVHQNAKAAATHKTEDTNDTKMDTENDKSATTAPLKDSRREASRTAFLRLARVLLSSQDSTVLHHCTASGSRDRKLSPGTLVLALRDGLRDKFLHQEGQKITPTRDAYYQEMGMLVSMLADAILWNPRNLLPTRRWVGLLSSDVLLNLSQLSLHAPPLAQPDLFVNVLNATQEEDDSDNHNAVSSLEIAGMHARRLLWPLMVDSQRSPLLHLFQQDRKATKNDHDQNTEQTVIRAMCRLLDTHPPPGRFALHYCLCRGIQMTPALLPALFQKLTLPDPNNKPFSFLARLRFVSHLLQQTDGLGLLECLPPSDVSSFIAENKVDSILRVISPVAFKTSIMGKAIQSKNALIVSEALKTIICILERLDSIKKELSNIPNIEADIRDSFWTNLSAKVIQGLPDIQAILSILSRFDMQGEDRAAPMVCSFLVQVLSLLASVVPGMLQEVKFDWIKLLPGKAEDFCRLPLFLQVRLLRTLDTLFSLSNVS